MMPSTNRMPPPGARLPQLFASPLPSPPTMIGADRSAAAAAATPPPPPRARHRHGPPAAGARPARVPVGPQPVASVRDPLEAEILDRGRVDLLQRTEPFAAEIARVAGPLVRQRLDDRRRIEAAGVSGRIGRADLDGLSPPVGMAGHDRAGVALRGSLSPALGQRPGGTNQQRRDKQGVFSWSVRAST